MEFNEDDNNVDGDNFEILTKLPEFSRKKQNSQYNFCPQKIFLKKKMKKIFFVFFYLKCCTMKFCLSFLNAKFFQIY